MTYTFKTKKFNSSEIFKLHEVENNPARHERTRELAIKILTAIYNDHVESFTLDEVEYNRMSRWL